MKGQWKGFVLGIVFTVLAATLAVPAFAALTAKDIQVYTGLDIYIDGVEMHPTDANGKPVEVFAYEGTTYVPLRAVSEYLGKAVAWDGTNQRVYIGAIPGQKQLLQDTCPPYQTSNYQKVDTISVAGNRYTDGFVVGQYTSFNPNSWANEDPGWALYNLNGIYNTLEFDIGHIDGWLVRNATLNIYLDGKLSYTLDLDPYAMPQHCVVPLNGALQMKIEMSRNGGNYCFINAEIH